MSDQALAVVERLWEELSPDDVVAGLADEAQRLARGEFYLNPEDGVRAAGIDPGRLPAD